MTEIATRWARDNWADVLDRVEWRDERFVITRNGKPIAQLGPLNSPQEGAAATQHSPGK